MSDSGEYVSTLALKMVMEACLSPEQRREVLSRLEIDPDELTRQHHFVPVPRGARTLWGEIQRATGDDMIGFHGAQRFPLANLGPLWTLLRSAKNLHTLLPVLQSVVTAVGTTHRVQLDVHGDHAFFQWRVRRRHHHDFDFIHGLALRIARTLIPGFHLIRVDHGCIGPTEAQAREYQEFYQCPVSFGARLQGGHFPAHLLLVDFQNPDPLLHGIAKGQMESLMPLGKTSDLNQEIADAYRQAVRVGQPDLDAIANRLGVSPAEAQRHLRYLRTTHQEQTDIARLRLAEQFLRETERPIANIAREVGFSHSASFAKAFRRLTGSSPRDYRNQHRQSRSRIAL